MLFSFLFKHVGVHVPKTAGFSLMNWLSAAEYRICGDFHTLRNENTLPQYLFSIHETIATVRENISDKLWNKLHRWAVVRNPYDRVVSAYYHNKLYKRHNVSMPEFIESLVQINWETREAPYCFWRHAWPQWSFINIDNKLACKLYRYEIGINNICSQVTTDIYENFKRDLQKNILDFGAPNDSRMPPILHSVPNHYHNSARTKPFWEELSRDDMRRIEEIYAVDFEKLNYPLHN